MTNQQIVQQLVDRIEKIIKANGSNDSIIYHRYGVDNINIFDVNCDNGIFELDYDSGNLIIPNHEIEEWNESYDETNNTISLYVKAKNGNFEFVF